MISFRRPLDNSNWFQKSRSRQIIFVLFSNLTSTYWKGGGFHDGGHFKGTTKYEAIRIIQSDDGLFIKANDAIFSRTFCTETCNGPKSFLPFTWVEDCRLFSENQWSISKADLTRTPLKFATSPYHASGSGASGHNELHSNNQKMNVYSKGWCGMTYFKKINGNWADTNGDNHPDIGPHLLPVTF